MEERGTEGGKKIYYMGMPHRLAHTGHQSNVCLLYSLYTHLVLTKGIWHVVIRSTRVIAYVSEDIELEKIVLGKFWKNTLYLSHITPLMFSAIPHIYDNTKDSYGYSEIISG